MKLLTFTTLYPNAVQTRHGIFVEQRLKHLLDHAGLEASVVAPVPWFPSARPVFGRYADFARVPRHERRHDIHVQHPRYPVVPKVGQNLAPFLLYRAMRPVLRDLLRNGHPFDLIDAHFFYPDGVAAVMLGRWLRKPVVITARGSDLNLMTRYAVPRRLIVSAARQAAGLITVCQALKDRLVELGISADDVTVLRNGVDLELFRPVDRAAARARLGLSGRTLLSVGNLLELKGHHLTIQALEHLPDIGLLLVGDGPERSRLEHLARARGVDDRVRFVGVMPQSELRSYYTAADALVLASSREGWANVLLESMACGTPVVATAVGGTPEVVESTEAGLLVEERSADAIAGAVARLFARYPDREAVRRYAERFDWEATSQGQLDLFNRVLDRHHQRRADPRAGEQPC